MSGSYEEKMAKQTEPSHMDIIKVLLLLKVSKSTQ
jgi:hypothetical protein